MIIYQHMWNYTCVYNDAGVYLYILLKSSDMLLTICRIRCVRTGIRLFTARCAFVCIQEKKTDSRIAISAESYTAILS
jgi:hypothetical protein